MLRVEKWKMLFYGCVGVGMSVFLHLRERERERETGPKLEIQGFKYQSLLLTICIDIL